LTNTDNDTPAEAPLIVSSFQPTSTGFLAEFNRLLDPSSLNLYDTQTSGFGPPDVTLVGAVNGPVTGSLVVDGAARTITFIKTRGPLEPDTYTVTLRSADNGFKDLDGGLLDGNRDGTTGDDYVDTFVVTPSAAVVVSVPDFTRGPGQAVDLLPLGVGIPISLNDGAGVTSVDFALVYDPELLTISAVTPGDSLPPGTVVEADLTTRGMVSVRVVAPAELGAGAIDLVRLMAEVPDTAPYRATHELFFTTVALNGGTLPAVADDGLHLVAYFGDTTGNGTYSALDGQRTLRVAVDLDSGFAAYPLVDPVLVADITANRAISALDATRILQEVVGLDRPEIPTLPTIAAISAGRGTVGTSLLIQGRDFNPTPGKTIVKFNGVPAVTTRVTDTTIDTLVPIGAATGPISVKTPSGIATSSEDFTVNLRQDFALSVGPHAGTVLQGSATTYTVELTPASTEPFTGLAALTVTGLPAGVTATLRPSPHPGVPRPTPRVTGDASAPVGASTLTVTATAAIDARSLTRTVDVTLIVQAGGRTALVGQVMLVDGTPLEGVILTFAGLEGQPTQRTDSAGNFQFLDLPASTHTLSVDTTPVNPTFPIYGVDVTLTTGQTTVLLPFKITPPPPPERFTPIQNATQDQVVADSRFPGVSIKLPAGVTITGWEGQPKTKIAIMGFSPDELPMPPPPGPTRSLYQFHFGTNMGGLPSAPLPVTLPNDQGLAPGAKAEIWYYDAAPFVGVPGAWRLAGLGTVSTDGSTVISDPGVGIARFCGVCGTTCIIQRGETQPTNDPNHQTGGDPVNLVLGQMIEEKTDLVLPGQIPAVVHRTYNPFDPFGGIAGFELGLGPGWALSVEVVLLEVNASLRRLVLPGNSRFHFTQQAPGSFVNTTHPRFAGAVLTAESGGRHRLRFKDGTIWRFSPHPNPNLAGTSLLSEQADRNANRLTIERDTAGKITRLIELAGRALTFTYTAGRISEIRDPIGRTVQYSYDGARRLETVTNPEGGITRYTYDSAARILTITDPRGITYLTNEYDATGRVVRQTQADGGVWRFQYLFPHCPPEVLCGLLSGPTGVIMTDPRGNTTTHRFNALGFASETVDALGQVTRVERDESGQVIAIADPLGRVTRFQYDGAGNVTTIADPAGNTRSFEYEPTFNRLTRLTDPLGNVTRFEYDARGNLISITDPLGSVTRIAYNEFGQPVSTTDPLGNMTRFTYDSHGNLATIADPRGATTRRTYDLVSRLIAQTDPRGRTTHFTYNELHRVKEIVDALNATTAFSYDGNGNLLTVTDARNKTISHTYDNMDRLETRTDPLSVVERFDYDAMGNLIHHTDRKSQTVTFSYDVLNRRTRASYADGATTNFVYDSVGRLAEATDSVGGTILNEYDSLDRLKAQTTNLSKVAYEYDALGRRTQMAVSGQAPVIYTHDASRLRTITQAPLNPVTIDYDALGRRTLLTLPNGVSTEYRYDDASRLTELIYRNATGVLGNLTYQYDPAGNRIEVGGSFARTLLPDPVTTATYDAANRQLHFGGRRMTLPDSKPAYDANGNLTLITDPSGVSTFTWDARNRLTSFTGPGTNATFAYDPLGRRLAKRINGQFTQFVYDGFDIVQEFVNNTPVPYLRSLNIDEPLVRDGGEFYLVDALGSSIALTGPTGSVHTEYTYDPFGKANITGTATNPFQYTGRENDETGSYYYRARYYEPTLARFLQEEPLGFIGVATNLYAYVLNNPLRFTDSTGMNPQLQLNGLMQGMNPQPQVDGLMQALQTTRLGSPQVFPPIPNPPSPGPIVLPQDPRQEGAAAGGFHEEHAHSHPERRGDDIFCEALKAKIEHLAAKLYHSYSRGKYTLLLEAISQYDKFCRRFGTPPPFPAPPGGFRG
jgi:RHS repeat-associated protein